MPTLKRGAQRPEPLGRLEDQQRQINDHIRVAKKGVKGQGSFNARFWANSRELETLLLQRAETERKIPLRDSEGTASEWEQTDKAQSIFQEIKAQETTMQLYQTRADKLQSTKKDQGKRTMSKCMAMGMYQTDWTMRANMDQPGAFSSRSAMNLFW